MNPWIKVLLCLAAVVVVAIVEYIIIKIRLKKAPLIAEEVAVAEVVEEVATEAVAEEVAEVVEETAAEEVAAAAEEAVVEEVAVAKTKYSHKTVSSSILIALQSIAFLLLSAVSAVFKISTDSIIYSP